MGSPFKALKQIKYFHHYHLNLETFSTLPQFFWSQLESSSNEVVSFRDEHYEETSSFFGIIAWNEISSSDRKTSGFLKKLQNVIYSLDEREDVI